MRIRNLHASFGVLQHQTLELGEGLNVIESANEGGKSTWSAFLRAMLYGIPTKERDRQGYLAEKHRYQPWSGAPMEGSMDLVWRGKEITLRRGPKGSSPFGSFQAVYTASGEPVDGLTGENVGELLTGVPREVFERSAFVGQGAAAIDGVPALEARIAALASSGEEVSCSQVERRLRDWRNRRQHHKTGLIPKLEGELAVLEDTLSRQAKAHQQREDARRDLDLLQSEKRLLEQELDAHNAQAHARQRRQYEAAQAALEAARAETDALRGELNRFGTPPDRDTLRRAQEDLNYLNTLNANQKLAKRRLAEAEQAEAEAKAAAEDEVFPGLTPDEAWQQASGDESHFHQKTGLSRVVLQAAGAVLAAAGLVGLAAALVLFPGVLPPVLIALCGIAVVCGAVFLVFAWRGKRQDARLDGKILSKYGAAVPEDILKRANAYREAWVIAAQAEKQTQAVQEALVQLTAQREELTGQLLEFAHTFAPSVTDTFGVSAAISRALGLEEKLAVAQAKLDGARRLAESLPNPGDAPAGTAEVTPRYDPAETAARLAAAEGELSRLRGAQAMAQGELNTLGDPALFQARREELLEQLQRRREEYEALTLALEGLEHANTDLQERFSPALNQRAGEIFTALTGGKYNRVTLTRQFEALGEEAGGITPRRAIALSKGTADQIYLAVRLALCDLALPAEDPAPLVLDDALVHFDDSRMALALEYLARLGRTRQILLFTCHGREAVHLSGRADAAILRLQS